MAKAVCVLGDSLPVGVVGEAKSQCSPPAPPSEGPFSPERSNEDSQPSLQKPLN